MSDEEKGEKEERKGKGMGNDKKRERGTSTGYRTQRKMSLGWEALHSWYFYSWSSVE